jgi:glucose 1-dehydrogenase
MDTHQPLREQKALVTGASSGIGKGIALALAHAGASVAVNFVGNASSAEEMVQEIRREGGTAIAVEADVSREDRVSAMFNQVIDTFGTVDILVNNAGIQRDARLVDMTLDQWNAVLGVNLTGYFLCARAAVREFLRRGVVGSVSKSAGKIICISSVHEIIPWAGHANYAASKGGIMMFMKTIAQELAPQHIRVNSIAPGAIKTPINRSAWSTPEAERRLLKLIPSGRVGMPEDIAGAAVWLASDASEYVQGQTIVVDGGMTLYPGFATGG